jgi:iron complex outermembrane receptor protein
MRRITAALTSASLIAIVSSLAVAPARAADAPASDGASSVGEVVVTARRKDENLQNVPMAVNAITNKDIAKYNVFNGTDLTALAPGLEFAPPPGQSDVNLSIRGAGKGPGTAASPTVQTYLNEAPVSATNAYQSIYDLGQVEVLRGPQGTLRGLPASSGAITFTTARANLENFGGYVEAAASNEDQGRFEGAVNLPIIKDVLAVRISGIHDHNDFDGVKSVNSTQKPFNASDSWRASVQFRPTSTLDVNFMFENFWSHIVSFTEVYGPGYQGSGLPANYNGPPLGIFDRLAVGQTPNNIEHHDQLATGQVNWDISPHLHLSYVGSYMLNHDHVFGGGDPGNFYPTVAPSENYDAPGSSISHELRIESSGNQFWDYGVGAFYQRSLSKITITEPVVYLPGEFGNPAGAQSLFNFNPIYSYTLSLLVPVQTTNEAIYANSTFHLTPKTELFVGLRYTDYTFSTAQAGGLVNGLSATGVPSSFCFLIPNAGAGPAFPSTAIPGQCDLPLPNSTLFSGAYSTLNYHPLVYTASLTQHFTRDITGYISFGHSWRAGVDNFDISSTDPRITSLSPTKPETSDNYEVGIKSQLFDRKLTVDVAVFYQTYKGFQVAATAPYINNTGSTLTVNTPGLFNVNADAKVTGVDFEAAYRPSEHFSASVGVDYARGRLSNAPIPCNDSNFDGIPDAGIPTVAGFLGAGVPIAFCKSNQALTNQPDWSANLQAEYNTPISSNADAYIRTLSTYTAQNNYALYNFVTKGYSLVNVYGGVREHTGRWDVGLFVRNLFDTREALIQGASDIATPTDSPVAGLGIGSSTGYRAVNLTERREVGATARYSF